MIFLLICFLYVAEPVLNMRESASSDSKVVSQALFSEEVRLNNEAGELVHITTPDNYSGWVLACALASRDEPYSGSLKVSRLAAHLYEKPDTEYGPILTLPYESRLVKLKSVDARWIQVELPSRKVAYIQAGDVAPERGVHKKRELPSLAIRYLGLPYTWGGRSSFGYDCSGFVQMLYRQMGVLLPRNSSDQYLDTRFEDAAIEALEPGDLIFFGFSQEQIRHVGLYIGHKHFIHATVRENQPWIRLSSIDDFEWSGHPDAHYPERFGRRWR